MHDTYNMAEFMLVSNTQAALGRFGAVKGHDAQQHVLYFNKNASPHNCHGHNTPSILLHTKSKSEYIH